MSWSMQMNLKKLKLDQPHTMLRQCYSIYLILPVMLRQVKLLAFLFLWYPYRDCVKEYVCLCFGYVMLMDVLYAICGSMDLPIM